MKVKELLNTTYNTKEELKKTLLTKVDGLTISNIVDKSDCVLYTTRRCTKNSWLKIFTQEGKNYMLHLVEKGDTIKVTKVEKENNLDSYKWEV